MQPTKNFYPTPAEQKLISFVNRAYNDWADGIVFVTPYMAFQMKLVTERCRKNYYGIYEERLDEITGEEKYWPPLTEHLVETVVKETDIDTKNLVPHSVHPAHAGIARVVKMLLFDKLKRMKMASKLNTIIRDTAIDGSKFLRCVKVWDSEKGKWVRDMALPDTLNVIADPAADSIEQSMYLERVIMSPSEFLKMKSAQPKGWTNLEYAVPARDIARTDTTMGAGAENKTPVLNYEVYEIWGEMPLSIKTGEDADDDKTFYGHCVMSGLGKTKGRNAPTIVHLIEESEYKKKQTKKPVKEVRFRKVPNRRQGRGVAEALFGAQLYLNTITGIRQMNGYMLQNGLFKARNGSGLTQEVIAQIAAGGVIPVEKMDDLEQLTVTDYRAASYTDEDRIFAWAQRQSFANEQVRGERTPTSQAATSSIIQDRSSKNAFSLIQEDFAQPIAEFFEEFIIPYLAEEYSPDEIVRVTGEALDFAEIDRAYVEHVVNQQLLQWIEENMSIPTMGEYQKALRDGEMELKKLGKSRHVKIWKDLLGSAELQMEMPITNERIDTPIIVQNLKEILAVNQANPSSDYDSDKIISSMLSLMGLDTQAYRRTYKPLPLPTDRYGETGAQAPLGAVRALGGAGAPNISRMKAPTAGPSATGVAANAQAPLRELANAGL